MHRFNLNLMCARSAIRESRLDWAVVYTRRALSLANAMRCRKRQALCLKILNWLRADLRRSHAAA